MSTRVLVVDGQQDVRDLIVGGLQDQGYEVLIAASGQECLAMARSQRPDVVCMEASLPDGDGFEMARRLLADPDTSRIPIIFLTARTQLQDRVEGLRLGVHAYLTKPFAFPELLATIEGIRQRRPRATDAPAPAVSAPASAGMGLMGSLGAISITSVVQAIESERQTGVLRIVSGTRWAQLAFHQGKIMAATTGARTGEKAIYEIVGWETGTYTFRAEPVEPGAPLAESTTSVLMRAFRHHDEQRAVT